MDNELKPKAAYRALDQLINEQWKTRAAVQTDAKGQAQFRGFFGRYQVKATSGNTTRQLEFDHGRTGPKTHRLTF